VTGAVVVAPDHFSRRSIFLALAAVFGAVVLVTLVAPLFSSHPEREGVS
jgi:hypothetical protein